MTKHCCFCDAKAPRSIKDSDWLSLRADQDPTHYRCPECWDENLLDHAKEWRAGKVGCFCGAGPNVTKWGARSVPDHDDNP